MLSIYSRLDEIRTRNEEKFVRINMTDKNRARYTIKHKPSVNRSNKKDDWYVVVTINILTNTQKKVFL